MTTTQEQAVQRGDSAPAGMAPWTHTAPVSWENTYDALDQDAYDPVHGDTSVGHGQNMYDHDYQARTEHYDLGHHAGAHGLEHGHAPVQNVYDLGHGTTPAQQNAYDLGHGTTSVGQNVYDLGHGTTSAQQNAYDPGHGHYDLGHHSGHRTDGHAPVQNAYDLGHDTLAGHQGHAGHYDLGHHAAQHSDLGASRHRQPTQPRTPTAQPPPPRHTSHPAATDQHHALGHGGARTHGERATQYQPDAAAPHRPGRRHSMPALGAPPPMHHRPPTGPTAPAPASRAPRRNVVSSEAVPLPSYTIGTASRAEVSCGVTAGRHWRRVWPLDGLGRGRGRRGSVSLPLSLSPLTPSLTLCGCLCFSIPSVCLSGLSSAPHRSSRRPSRALRSGHSDRTLTLHPAPVQAEEQLSGCGAGTWIVRSARHGLALSVQTPRGEVSHYVITNGASKLLTLQRATPNPPGRIRGSNKLGPVP